jgi:uncharacterized membrane protein YoaT (DUF817 family)
MASRSDLHIYHYTDTITKQRFFFASTIYVTYFLFHFLKDIQAAIYSFIILLFSKSGLEIYRYLNCYGQFQTMSLLHLLVLLLASIN